MPHFRFSCRMIWRKGQIDEQTLGRLDASEKMDDHLVHTTPNHNPPKMDGFFAQKLYFKSSLLLVNGYCIIQVRPTNSSDDLCLFFCLFLLLWRPHTYYSQRNLWHLYFPLFHIYSTQCKGNLLETENYILKIFFIWHCFGGFFPPVSWKRLESARARGYRGSQHQFSLDCLS